MADADNIAATGRERKAFAGHYRALVVPRLLQMCRVQGLFLATGLCGWSEAHEKVRDLAIRLGALSLPADLGAELLDDRIAAWLLEAVTAAETEIPALEADIALERETDPVGHYTRLAGSCEAPVRWAFASISPEYRASLRRG